MTVTKEGLDMTLATLKTGKKGLITKIEVDDGATKRRLMNMGLLVGEEVYVDRVAPFGGPIDITIKGYNISLHKKEAQGIIIDIDGSLKEEIY
jgi:Fe2+ transport system protein FeoA